MVAAPEFLDIGLSRVPDADGAVREATALLGARELCFVIALIPASLDVTRVAELLDRTMSNVPVFGCTTAGQITPNGYEDDALLLLGFPRAHFRCASLLFEDMAPDKITRFAAETQRRAERFGHTAYWNRLALIFADGLSKQEDLLVSSLHTVLGDVQLFGGSAGDGVRFEETFVLHDGTAYSRSAVLVLIETDLQFQGLAFDHFLPAGAQIVITDAEPEERLVHEINGAPAAGEYARLVGCAEADLCPEVFAEHPMLLRHDMAYYARAISAIKDGHSLSLLAAIDVGLILRLGEEKGGLEALCDGLDVRDPKGRAPDFILGFDCFLRRLEFEQKQMLADVSGVLCGHRVVGFNTYGEQRSGVHMNQTFVGVAFFDPDARVLN